MHRIVAAVATAAVVVPAFAQPVVPAGFQIASVSGTLDGQVPALVAVQHPVWGNGVITAAAGSGVATLRLLAPNGQIVPLAVWEDAANDAVVHRVRVDTDPVFGGEIHATLVPADPSGSSRTQYITIDTNGLIVERFLVLPELAYDFEISDGAGNNPIGSILVDGDFQNGSELAWLSPSFVLTTISSNSVPSGRIDMDVAGLRRDATGNYGGGIIIADSESGQEDVSAIYELKDANSAEQYRTIAAPQPAGSIRYGDLDIAELGVFGGVIYVTETLTDEIQQVAPDGTHTTWATGFVGLDSLSISPDGESMYVADLNGVWLIRPEGNEPGPAVLAQDPSTPDASPMTGAAVSALRVIFTDPVSFVDADVTITDDIGQSVAFDASGSGSQFMIIGLADPLEHDTYTVMLADTITSVATGQALDGDNDGVAGEDAVLSFAHACEADCNLDGTLNIDDIDCFVASFLGGCP